MSTGHQKASKHQQSIQALGNPKALAERLLPRHDALPPRIPSSARLTTKAIEDRWVLFLEHDPHVAACTVKDEGGTIVVDQVVAV